MKRLKHFFIGLALVCSILFVSNSDVVHAEEIKYKPSLSNPTYLSYGDFWAMIVSVNPQTAVCSDSHPRTEPYGPGGSGYWAVFSIESYKAEIKITPVDVNHNPLVSDPKEILTLEMSGSTGGGGSQGGTNSDYGEGIDWNEQIKNWYPKYANPGQYFKIEVIPLDSPSGSSICYLAGSTNQHNSSLTPGKCTFKEIKYGVNPAVPVLKEDLEESTTFLSYTSGETTKTYSIEATNAESYQWQMKERDYDSINVGIDTSKGGDYDSINAGIDTSKGSWINVGTDSPSFTIDLNNPNVYNKEYEIRCIVTGSSGSNTVTTKTATCVCDTTPKVTADLNAEKCKLTQDVISTGNLSYRTYSGSRITSYRWEESADNINWTTMSGRTTDTANISMSELSSKLNVTRYIRCVASCAGKDAVSSVKTIETDWTPLNGGLVFPTEKQYLNFNSGSAQSFTAKVQATGADSYEWFIGETSRGFTTTAASAGAVTYSQKDFKMEDFGDMTNVNTFIKIVPRCNDIEGTPIILDVETNWCPTNISLEPNATQSLDISGNKSFKIRVNNNDPANYKAKYKYNWYIGDDTTPKCQEIEYTPTIADFGQYTNISNKVLKVAVSCGNQEENKKTLQINVSTDWHPIFLRNLNDDGKPSITGFENTSSFMFVSADFPKAGDGWFEWQYKDATDNWVSINNSTGLLSGNFNGDSNAPYSGIFVLNESQIKIESSATSGSSTLGIKANTAMNGSVFRVILHSGINGGTDAELIAESPEKEIRVIEDDYNNFIPLHATKEIGDSIYENTSLIFQYGSGVTKAITGELEKDFVNDHGDNDRENDTPYYYMIDIDKAYTDGLFKNDVNYQNILDGRYDLVASDFGVSPADPDVLSKTLRGVFKTPENLMKYARTTENPIRVQERIKDGKNTPKFYYSFLMPLHVHGDVKANGFKCTGTPTPDGTGKCSVCEYAIESDIANYIFAAKDIIGVDSKAPTVNITSVDWISAPNKPSDHEGTYHYGQYSKGQQIKITAEIEDNVASKTVENGAITVRWFHISAGGAETEITEGISADKRSVTITPIEGSAYLSNGTYQVRVSDDISNNGVSEDHVELGSPWDDNPPVIQYSVSPSETDATTYKELSLAESVDGESGLADKAYLFSTEDLTIGTSDKLSKNSIYWESANGKTFIEEGKIYVYVRDNAGNIAKKAINIVEIDHESPVLDDFIIKNVCTTCGLPIDSNNSEICTCDAKKQHQIVTIQVKAHDNKPGVLYYKYEFIADKEHSDAYGETSPSELALDVSERTGHAIYVNDGGNLVSTYTTTDIITAEDSGYYRVYIKDSASNVYVCRTSYIDLDFLTGNLGDIFREDGTDYKDEDGGFKDEKGGCEDHKGGFIDEDGGFKDGFIDEDGGFKDVDGFVNKKGFIDACGYVNTDGFDESGFVDDIGFVDVTGYVDTHKCSDLKGNKTRDFRCDNCGRPAHKCTCPKFIDEESPDLICDTTLKPINECTTCIGKDSKCDNCGKPHNYCECEPDGLCDKCYKNFNNCEHRSVNSYDGLCDNCFKNRDACRCNNGPDGYCDVCGTAVLTENGRIICPQCTANSIENDDCDICHKTWKAHQAEGEKICAEKDGLCDICAFSYDNCTCEPEKYPDALICDICGKTQSNCRCGDGFCDICGAANIDDCTCPDGLCDYCGHKKSECKCDDGFCNKCDKKLSLCKCGDGLCDNCNLKEFCNNKDCDGYGTRCEKFDIVDGEKIYHHCVCGDGNCDECGHKLSGDSEHKGFCTDPDCKECKDLLCDNDLCKKCGKNKLACTCVDGFEAGHICGLPEVCRTEGCDGYGTRCKKFDVIDGKKVFHHCMCGDGICDICGRRKEDGCNHTGGSVVFSANPNSWTNADYVTLKVTTTGDLLHDTNPYSWDGGNTWTNDNTFRVYDNGSYKVKVKLKSGNVKESHELIVDYIDREAPVVTYTVDKDTKKINVYVKDNRKAIDKLYYKFTPISGIASDFEYPLAQVPDTDSKDTFEASRVVSELGEYEIIAYDKAGNRGSDIVLISADNMSSDNPDVVENPDIMLTYITSSPEQGIWTSGGVTLAVNMSTRGLANNPYSWEDGIWTNLPYYTVQENQAVTLTVKDSFGHTYKASPFVVSNIDKEAPEFELEYDKNNGDYLKVKAKDTASGLSSIWWQSDVSPHLTKVMDIPADEASGGSFAVNVPANAIYKIFVVDRVGNGNNDIFAKQITVNATSAKTNTNNKDDDDSNGNNKNGGLSDADWIKLLTLLKGSDSNSGSGNSGSGNSGLSDSVLLKLLSSLNTNSNTGSGSNTNPYGNGYYYPNQAPSTSSNTTTASRPTGATTYTNPYQQQPATTTQNFITTKDDKDDDKDKKEEDDDESKEENKAKVKKSDSEEKPAEEPVEEPTEEPVEPTELSNIFGPESEPDVNIGIETEPNVIDNPSKTPLWMILLFIVLLLGIVGAGGYYYLSKKKENDLIDDGDDDLFGNGDDTFGSSENEELEDNLEDAMNEGFGEDEYLEGSDNQSSSNDDLFDDDDDMEDL